MFSIFLYDRYRIRTGGYYIITAIGFEPMAIIFMTATGFEPMAFISKTVTRFEPVVEVETLFDP